MKFKIHTKEVKRAMKKTGLDICSGKWYGYKYLTTQNESKYDVGSACPISQLYTAETDTKENWLEHKAESWAKRKFGKAYVKGFITAFDGSDKYNEEYLKLLNKKYQEDYKAGFKNGKALRKQFILKEKANKN